MYVHGMSTRDIEATFSDVLDGTGVSNSIVNASQPEATCQKRRLENILDTRFSHHFGGFLGNISLGRL